MLIARKAEDGRIQPLFTHLQQVADASKTWSSVIGFPNTGKLFGQCHDLGKILQSSQAYLNNPNNSFRGSVIHSTQGARLIYQNTREGSWELAVLGEVIANCIAGHHGTLSDGISPDGGTPLSDRLSQEDEKRLHYSEFLSTYQDTDLSSNLKQQLNDCATELKTFLQRCKEQNLDVIFMAHMLTKFLYSCLVDADRYNAYCFETNIPFTVEPPAPPWDSLLLKLETYLNHTQPPGQDSTLYQIRQNISQKCLDAAVRPRDIYKLEVPTGGGKTFSSLRFALSHAKKHKMKHIIYIIPYLSILDQTAKDIRVALDIANNSDLVLEHHSDLIPADDAESAQKLRLLTNRWDAPIILTTMVQFLESVFSEKSSALRKLHNMKNSILVFDEVQSLPVKCVHLFNQAVNFLCVFCHSTAILCTATQPLLERAKRPIHLSSALPSLIPSVEGEFQKLGRTRIIDSRIFGGYSYESLTDFVLEKQANNGSCLVILNTKINVTRLYETIQNYLQGQANAPKLYHLTTLMCPAHRLKIIGNMKADLANTDANSNAKNPEPVICISSQLIEAGVNISFGCVIRAIAGLDSVAQAAGRCNRHGEDPNGREVYLVNLAEENLSKLPDVRCGAEVTKRILDENHNDLLSSETMHRYYDEYFYKRQNQMDYPIGESGNIYDLLSLNKKSYNTLCNRSRKPSPALPQAFQTAGKAFCVIEKNTADILVPYGAGSKLAENFQRANLTQKTKLLRKMGRYSVTLYPYQVRKLEEMHAFHFLEDGVLLLDKQYYDKDKGVIFKAEMEFLCD